MTEWNDIERLVHDRIDGALSAADTAKLEALLARDPALAQRARELAAMVRDLRSLADESAPPDFARRVMARVEVVQAPRQSRSAWRAGLPAALAAAAMIVAALWVGRGSMMPPTLTAEAPAQFRDASDDAASDAIRNSKRKAGAPKAVAADDGVELKRDDRTASPEPGFMAGAREERTEAAAPSDALLDALASTLRDGALVRGIDASEVEVSKLEESELPGAVPSTDSPKAQADALHWSKADGDDDADSAPRVILLRRVAVDDKRRGSARNGLDGAAALDALLPPAERSNAAYKETAKSAPSPANEANDAKPDALVALVRANESRMRDVALDDAALEELLDRARGTGFDAFALDTSAFAGTSKDAEASREEDAEAPARASALRWIPLNARSQSATPPPAGGQLKSAKREAPPRRRTILILGGP
jgi:hypothetical protein